MIFGWGGKSGAHRERRRARPSRPRSTRSSASRPATSPWSSSAAPATIRRILVPVRGGPHAELALRFADALAHRHDATVVVIHLVPAGVTEAVRAQAEHALAAFVAPARHRPLRAASCARPRNVRTAILREAEHADLVVMGASAPPGERRHARCSAPCRRPSPSAPSPPSSWSRRASPSAARRSSSWPRRPRRWPPPTAPPRSRAPSRPRWSAGSPRPTSTTASSPTWRASTALKEKQGVTVSLVLPTLNEAETIGPDRARARSARCRSASRCSTRSWSSTPRPRTTPARSPRPRARASSSTPTCSRGTARSAARARRSGSRSTRPRGDIVVWADTDVRNWHHRMVYGTLGPLLVEPRLQYVKGYYQRPIVEGGVLKEGGGGRVTELVARPLINLFFPELSGLIQPLAGRVRGPALAARADPVLHGVRGGDRAPHRRAREGGARAGSARWTSSGGVHRNQELEGLSRMSFVILQAVMKRLEERRRVRLFAELGSTMKLPRSGHGPAVAGGHGARGPRAARR